MDTSVENVSSNVNTRVSNRLTEFIENNAGLIDCAEFLPKQANLQKQMYCWINSLKALLWVLMNFIIFLVI